MKRLLCILLILLMLLPSLGTAEASFTYIYLDCKPILTGVLEDIPFVILTNRPSVTEQRYEFRQTLEHISSVYFWNHWEKRYYQVMENYQQGITGQAYDAALIQDYNPRTMSGTVAFGYHGQQELYYPLTCETYVVTHDDYYEYIGAMVDLAVDDCSWDYRGFRITSEKKIARNLHDWLCERMVFDEGVTAGSSGYSFGQKLYLGSGYGGLHSGVGKCTSYANAYQLLLRAAGIECFVVNGTANNGRVTGSHAWNIARLDGQWCFIDVTWDDSAYRYGYDYFAVSKSQMDRNHFLSNESAAFVNFLMRGGLDQALRNIGR